jgi:DNA (cytosine-5)-methyltransferase 1
LTQPAPDPSKNHGGILILQETICIAGNTIDREPENGGNGLGCQPDITTPLQPATGTQCVSHYQEVVGRFAVEMRKAPAASMSVRTKCIVERRNLYPQAYPSGM